MAAVDVDGLAGHEVAVGGAEKDHRPYEVFRVLVSLKAAAAAAVCELRGCDDTVLLRA